MIIPNDIRRNIETKLDNDPNYADGLSMREEIDLQDVIYTYAIIGEREDAEKQARKRKSAEDIMRDRSNRKPRTNNDEGTLCPI